MYSSSGLEQIVGTSHSTIALRARVQQVAAYRYNVLITGPTGTGKELVARAIHAHSNRASRAFIPVNCAALAGGLFESQLFGHLKGSFTGASYNSIGCFRAADGGTIFLDEIAELDIELQAKLLRVIQDRQITPVGAHDGAPVDVRIVAATNRDLNAEVQAGRFRLDLFYRLNVVSFETTPLADRREDIRLLAEHFLAKAAVENGVQALELSPEAIGLLQTHDWPGNIRELQNLIERAVVFATGDTLGPECFPELAAMLDHASIDRSAQAYEQTGDFAGEGAYNAADEFGAGEASTSGEWLTLADVERDHIQRTLEQTGFNQSAAARLLGIDRKLLSRKIKRYQLRVPSRV